MSNENRKEKLSKFLKDKLWRSLTNARNFCNPFLNAPREERGLPWWTGQSWPWLGYVLFALLFPMPVMWLLSGMLSTHSEWLLAWYLTQFGSTLVFVAWSAPSDKMLLFRYALALAIVIGAIALVAACLPHWPEKHWVFVWYSALFVTILIFTAHFRRNDLRPFLISLVALILPALVLALLVAILRELPDHWLLVAYAALIAITLVCAAAFLRKDLRFWNRNNFQFFWERREPWAGAAVAIACLIIGYLLVSPGLRDPNIEDVFQCVCQTVPLALGALLLVGVSSWTIDRFWLSRRLGMPDVVWRKLALLVAFASITIAVIGVSRLFSPRTDGTNATAQKKDGAEKKEAAEKKDGVSSEALLSLFAILATVGGFGLMYWGFWFQGKMDHILRLEHTVDELNGLAVVAAESAFASLPDFSASQQIPDSTVATLHQLKTRIFDEPGQSIIKYLDKTRQGGRLHYAKALYYFGIADFVSCERTLRKDVIGKEPDPALVIDSRYRLGICYRQLNQWERSIKAFLKLAQYDTQTAKGRAKLGIIVTLLAARPSDQTPDINVDEDSKANQWWQNTRREVCRQFGIAEDYNPGIEDCTWSNLPHWFKIAMLLSVKLHEEEGDNILALSYFAKCAHHVIPHLEEPLKSMLKSAIANVLGKVEGIMIGYPLRDDNLAISYHMFLGWCYWIAADFARANHGYELSALNWSLSSEECLKRCVRHFEQVQDSATRYETKAKEVPYSHLIYSEVDEKEVPAEDIATQAKTLSWYLRNWHDVAETHIPFFSWKQLQRLHAACDGPPPGQDGQKKPIAFLEALKAENTRLLAGAQVLVKIQLANIKKAIQAIEAHETMPCAITFDIGAMAPSAKR